MLVSSLFRDDPRLQECLVKDPAHLTPGTRGRAVARVQMALFAIDGVKIDRGEINTQTYGPSTTAAVLAFKRKRGIINFSYQTSADNIVGKMTIARLDAEMVLVEKTSRRPNECSCCPPGSPDRSSFVATEVTGGPAKAPKQIGKTLHIACAMSKKTQNGGGFNLEPMIKFAEERLKTFGLKLAVDFGSATSPEVINFVDNAVLEDSIAEVRQAFEQVHPNANTTLPVIVCNRSFNGNPGETFRDIKMGTNTFKTFILINADLTASTTPKDNNVLLHEMIHCAHKSRQNHDPEPDSVFEEKARTDGAKNQKPRVVLLEKRALELAEGYFAR